MSKWLTAFFIGITFLTLSSRLSPVFAQNWVDSGYGEALEGCRGGGDVALECHAKKVDDVPKINLIEQIMGPVPGLTTTADVWERNPEYARSLLQGSALVQVNNAIIAMYANPPANTMAFIMDAGQSLGFIPRQTYAQGIGFSGLSPLLPIWKIFRNIAYVFLAFVLVIVGFMVMLRKKIDPKTVVTVQNALPKVIVTLILITFSYAIVGIMIDSMYLIILVAVAILEPTGLLQHPTLRDQILNFINQNWGFNSIRDVMTTGGLNAIFRTIFPNISLLDLSGDIIGYNPVAYGAAGITGLTLMLAPIPVLGQIAGGTIAAVSFGPPLIIYLLLSLALIFIFIRLLIMFVSAYIQIMLGLILGPIQILGEAIPGSNSFSSWFKNIFSNIIVFPLSSILFMLCMVFENLADSGGGKLWSPPYISMFSSVSSISALFSIGLLAAIPSIVEGIKQTLKAKPMVDAGPGAVIAPLGTAWGTATGAVSMFYYGKEIFKGLPIVGKKHSPEEN